nr:MAG: hypothetical protein [Marsupenaeus japonicus endogenous nimavirus]
MTDKTKALKANTDNDVDIILTDKDKEKLNRTYSIDDVTHHKDTSYSSLNKYNEYENVYLDAREKEKKMDNKIISNNLVHKEENLTKEENVSLNTSDTNSTTINNNSNINNDVHKNVTFLNTNTPDPVMLNNATSNVNVDNEKKLKKLHLIDIVKMAYIQKKNKDKDNMKKGQNTTTECYHSSNVSSQKQKSFNNIDHVNCDNMKKDTKEQEKMNCFKCFICVFNRLLNFLEVLIKSKFKSVI